VHELSICGSIADIVQRSAGGRRVETINLQIGQLRQVVPETLVYCWSLVSADTPLDGSALNVDSVPVRIQCRSCGDTTEIGQLPILLCGTCGQAEVTLVSGEEFLITSLELAEV
jgi:hydrogenase nickel incorporation protein HypA/HybF